MEFVSGINNYYYYLVSLKIESIFRNKAKIKYTLLHTS